MRNKTILCGVLLLGCTIALNAMEDPNLFPQTPVPRTVRISPENPLVADFADAQQVALNTPADFALIERSPLLKQAADVGYRTQLMSEFSRADWLHLQEYVRGQTIQNLSNASADQYRKAIEEMQDSLKLAARLQINFDIHPLSSIIFTALKSENLTDHEKLVIGNFAPAIWENSNLGEQQSGRTAIWENSNRQVAC